MWPFTWEFGLILISAVLVNPQKEATKGRNWNWISLSDIQKLMPCAELRVLIMAMTSLSKAPGRFGKVTPPSLSSKIYMSCYKLLHSLFYFRHILPKKEKKKVFFLSLSVSVPVPVQLIISQVRSMCRLCRYSSSVVAGVHCRHPAHSAAALVGIWLFKWQISAHYLISVQLKQTEIIVLDSALLASLSVSCWAQDETS